MGMTRRVSQHGPRTTDRDTVETVDAITDAMLTASRLLVSLSARSIASVDESITIAQFRVMVVLETRGPMNLASLAQSLDVQPSTVTRMVDRLVLADLITREASARSRRELIVTLTDRGADVVREVTARRRGEIAAVVEKMSPTSRVGLVRALKAFSAAGAEPDAVPARDLHWA
jgi:DNA-binding MarR family transcriptional regulator